MPNSRDRILTYIRQEAGRPLKPRELARALRIPQAGYRSFRRLLKQLEHEGLIIRLRHNRLGPREQPNLTTGRLNVNPGGFGFVSREGAGADVYVGPAGLHDAAHGDRVVVRMTTRSRGGSQPEGEVIRVLERAVRSVVGTYRSNGRSGFVQPDDPRLLRDVSISPAEASEPRPGQKVVVQIETWPAGGLNPQGRVTKILGEADDPGKDILGVIHEFGLPLEFPPHVRASAAEIPKEIPQKEIARRIDLRNLPCVTIDPQDARDHDDAVSLQVEPDGSYRLGVHIADVSHFVPEGSVLDLEARARGTSVYLPDRVLPMLPEALSGDICSLRPGEDRLAFSVRFHVSPDGHILDSRIEETVVCSRARLSYREVQQVLDGDSEAEQPQLSSHADMLRAMEVLRLLLTRRRFQKGAIDFGVPEPRVILSSEGETVSVEVVERLNSHRLIEEFMLLANETVAKRLSDGGVPALYRVHDRPDPARLGEFARLAAAFGSRLPGVDRITPHGIQKFLEGLEGKPAHRVLSSQLLRSMKKAVYSPQNIGHFGLACSCYTHFTSPIRRYPDLLVHRLLKESGSGQMSPDRRTQLSRALPAISDLATQREILAQEAERGALQAKLIRFLEGRIGEHFKATVVSVTAGGMFCELDGVLVDGFVRVSSITDDHYDRTSDHSGLVGERTGRTFRLGDRVTVKLAAADRHRRRIDLLVVEGGEMAPQKAGVGKRRRMSPKGQRQARRRRTTARR